MMSEWERNHYRAYLVALKGDGYEFEITSRGYFVKLNGKGLGGAGTIEDNYKKKRRIWQHERDNITDNLKSAVLYALNHKESSQKAEV